MSLTLYSHPLASFCHKVLIALYENATPFSQHVVDLMDETSSKAFKAVWPMAKMPVLRDDARDRTIPESSIIIEYLARHYPGKEALVPTDPEQALQVRLSDRFYDFYVQQPMQKIVTDRIRPEGRNDPHGVETARSVLRTAYGEIERTMQGRQWATGDRFTMADCAAAPALFYAEKVLPFRETHPAVAAYFGRLMDRPSFARVLREAQPYFDMFPSKD
ncbi:MAG: glutathione S-transferase family protein [Phyllobacterium sp.]